MNKVKQLLVNPQNKKQKDIFVKNKGLYRWDSAYKHYECVYNLFSKYTIPSNYAYLLANDINNNDINNIVWNKTVVIFRKFKNNDVIAIFPEELGTNNPYTCMSYMTVGQHASCDCNIITQTSPASYDEYASLLWELRRLGYWLDIKFKTTKKHLEIRKEKLSRI